MQLFCNQCSTYLGPHNAMICPNCGSKMVASSLHQEAGNPVWDTPVELAGHPIGRPVQIGDTILVAWRKGKIAGGLSAIDKQGRISWQIHSSESPIEGILADGERAYFCTSGMLDGGTVYCLKANTPNSGGEIIWHQRHPHVVKGKLQGKALLKEKRLYIPCKGGKILCLDAATGQAVPGWIGQTEMEIDWLLESSQDLIAVSKETGSLFLVDPLRGRQDGPAMHLNFRITCEPVVWKENVFLCNDKGQLIKVNLRQRQAQNFAEGFNKICASPIIHDNGLFAGAHDHHIYAWDVNGSLKWRSNFCTDHAISSSPAIANDMLAIGANDGKAYGLSLDTGERMWTFDPGLGNAFVRDVLFHDGIFYLGMAQSNKPSGFLYALPWHLGEYEDIASRFTAKGKNLEAANLFAVAAHYASRNRDELSEKAANCWIEGGSPRLAVEYWLGLAKPKKAAQCWIIAAEDRRGRDNLQAAEYYYEASRLFWRLGDTDNEDRCYHEAVELGKWPRLRLKVINNPVLKIGKQGYLTVRVENIGYSQAQDLHFDVGGSLLEAISFNMIDPLDRDRHCDLCFVISPTRENDTVRVEVSNFAAGRSLAFRSQLDIQVQAEKVTIIQLDGIVKSQVRIINEDGKDMEIIAKDMVMSQLEIINKN